MARVLLIAVILSFVALADVSLGTTVSLYDWAINVNGDLYERFAGNTPPPSFVASGFVWNTGLGTLRCSALGGGGQYVIVLLDHDIDVPINTYFNEYGEAVGTPMTGQSWEIDEPGYVFGDIYDHVQAGTLDNSNGVPVGLPDDVSMALGWAFDLPPGGTADIDFVVGLTAPTSPFYLAHTDPDSGETLYFHSTFTPAVIPEPLTACGLMLGIGSLAGYLRRRR